MGENKAYLLVCLSLVCLSLKIESMGIGMQEILVIALLVLLLFGGKKIPELMKGLGKGVKSFKDGMNGKLDDEQDEPKKKDE